MKLKSLLVFFLTALLFVLPVTSVLAAGDPAITVDMPDTVEPGKQFVMSVNIENNPGWSALQFEITYDADQMTLLDVEDGEALQDPYAIFSYNEHTKGAITAIGLYNDTAATIEESGNMEKNGTLMQLYFQVADDVAAGAEISVKVDLQSMCNAQLESQMDPTVIKAVTHVGTMAAEDNKTQPSKSGQAVVSGMVGTYPSWTVSQTDADGQVTNAAGEVVDKTGDDVTTSSFPWVPVLVVAAVAVIVLAVLILFVFVLKRKKKYYR